jgi:hypothetical protein
MRYRPTPADKRIIRECAARASRAAGCSSDVALKVGERSTLTGEGKRHINVRLISTDPTGSDTDLYDTLSWGSFASGFDLTEDGRGLIDFYVYERKLDRSLATNVQAYIENGQLSVVKDGKKVLWFHDMTAAEFGA